jgi:hypothetical protein
MRQPNVQRAACALGIRSGPCRLEQRVGRDRATGVEQQAREHHALLGSGRRGRPAVEDDVDRAKNAEPHGTTLRQSASRR